MASTTTGHNRRFCWDILRIIFDYYQPYETFDYPLETFLLVCKDWHAAALSHRRLWSQFQLHIEHEDTHSLVIKRTALRLKRSGTAPIDIEILNLLAIEASHVVFEAGYNEELPPDPSLCPFSDDEVDIVACKGNGYARTCFCLTSAYSCACQLLLLLAGSEGEHCKRWRTLTFYPSDGYEIRGVEEEAWIAQALRHPTPILESLTLQHISVTGLDTSFLPHTPSLLQLALDSCDIPSLHGTQNLRFAGISWELDNWRPGFQKQAHLQDARELEVLRISLPGGFNLTLPRALPRLRELWLMGHELPYSIHQMEVEGLRQLTIGIDGVSLITELAESVNQAFWHVNKLTLWNHRLYERDHPAFKSAMSELLKQLDSLDVLRGDTNMLGFIIKLMWEQLPADHNVTYLGSSRIFAEREIELHRMFDDEPRHIISPGAVRQDIVDVAEHLEVVDPRTDWSVLLELFEEHE